MSAERAPMKHPVLAIYGTLALVIVLTVVPGVLVGRATHDFMRGWLTVVGLAGLLLVINFMVCIGWYVRSDFRKLSHDLHGRPPSRWDFYAGFAQLAAVLRGRERTPWNLRDGLRDLRVSRARSTKN